MPALIACGAVLMTLLGGWVAQRVTDRRHLVPGLAGGLMLGVVGLDLLPEALDAAGRPVFGVPLALLCFVLGFLAAHALERLLAVRRAARGSGPPGAAGAVAPNGGRVPQVGLTAATAMVLHSVMDGFAIGLALQAGHGMATGVAIAVSAHDFADGFNTYTVTSLYGNARRRVLLMLGADAVAPPAGAAATLVVTLPEQWLGGCLGFFGGVLLHLATSGILPEAHHAHPALPTLARTAAGAGAIRLVVGLAG